MKLNYYGKRDLHRHEWRLSFRMGDNGKPQ